MKVLQIIKNWAQARREPEILNTWEITRIGNPTKFLQFVISNVTDKAQWQINGIMDKSNLEPLTNLTSKKGVVEIDNGNIEDIIAILPGLNLEGGILEQKLILKDGTKLLISYDNLSCVWVSKIISEEKIKAASIECDFDYEDFE